MRRSSLWVGLAAGALALFAFGPARMLAQPGPAAGEREARAAIEKVNAYIELMKMTERAVDSWERYASWVNLKTGPTGRERYISYGMYELHDAESVLKEAREAAGKAPAAPALDAMIGRYVDSYLALAPTMNRAADYYERRAYRADGMKEGRALHAKMVPLAQAFLKERNAAMPLVRAFLREAERRELAMIEARDGRGRAWQVGQVMAAANRMVDVFPRDRPAPMDGTALEEKMQALGPNSSGEEFDAIISGRASSSASVDMKKYDQALKDYKQAVALFDAFAKEKPDGLDSFAAAPRALLEALRAAREPLARGRGRPAGDANALIGRAANIYFSMLSESSSLTESRLRFLM